MNEIRAVTIFARAAVLGSLRRAAVDQGISPQAASHAVMQLEKELGVRLFHRTTRKLSLTEEGQQLLESVAPALAMFATALDDARRSRQDIAGPLRVSAPRTMARHVIWPALMAFAAEHPSVQLDVQFDDQFTDLVADRADVGFRGGSPPAEGAIARRLVPIQLIVCASPAYLARHGTPRTIEALDAHRCTGYRRVNTGKLAPWEFMVGDEIQYRDVPAVLCTNDAEAETDAVVAGLGIGQLGSFSAAGPIRAGLLVPLLTQHLTQRESFYIYYRRRTEQPLRVKAFIDFMVERLADNQDFFLTRAELTRPRKPGA
ncbi:LysR family transcriptional regulator [Achromobacter marplatensis]|jgi:DNA-binding transcriptional LysR family regulator|uniref:DNA-binding transcriptional LysR family regulator n=1 Tax=Achromobacter marplatensis TaxID=470868 RepID=J4QK96_9BURK|nr:LysR family transcriptional regulator [Achromobacter marplatensis]EJO28140.1 LysR family transcriptional regulator [Achromobacter marplatensis]MDH2049902.1 LysR family transcriptional regulator [Achromobacter marplatensis]OWT72187.1 LysR family transcriptional regulator [Achromobacter marplatensis]RBP24538.1 DNA-binding transcriptional LysR family regulator [Achromobacter marplatensis]CAB3626161.1 HTH-type transcriptional regulator DmlR [Achromobacter marplatensis]